jgi:energy-converting hydrogenase A subunit R
MHFNYEITTGIAIKSFHCDNFLMMSLQTQPRLQIKTSTLKYREPPKAFVTDCEGPITKNDNAFELSQKFIADGGEFFTRVSKYDDVLADVVKKPGYNAGDTLKLILPFLKAYDVDNEKMRNFSKEKILIIPEADKVLNRIRKDYDGNAFIVSTSYQQYIEALCNTIKFPIGNAYSTTVDIDEYDLAAGDRSKLQGMAGEIASMPKINIPDSNRLSDFSDVDKKTVYRMDQIFWKEIPKMDVGEIFDRVKPVGYYEKEKAVKLIVNNLKTEPSNVMYVGDSITDAKAFDYVRKSGGLAVSFNGNKYAVDTADLGIMAGDAIPVEELAYLFRKGGRAEVMQYAEKIDNVTVLTAENRPDYAKESGKFRKNVRSKEIGSLG